MNKHFIITMVVAALVLCSCAEKKSPLDAQARDRGTRAAAALIAVDHTDTLALQRAILDAKAVQSEYVFKRDSLAVKAFDEAFMVYLQQYDEPLYKAIFPNVKP